MKLTANQVLSPVSPQQADKGGWTQLLRIMKLTTIIILAACLHVSAKGIAQQTITFSGKEVNLENVFNAIKKQTNYRFFFNTDMLKNASKVTIEVKNAQIEQVMNLALKDQPLTFAIKGRTIFIMKKPEEEKKSVQVASPTGDPITVSGRVTDDQGQPLVGANVKVKGTSTGVTTDGQGRFTLNNVDPNATLEVSFVGHETQLLAVRGKTVFSVTLGQRQSILDETVVIAYGTTSRRFSTGNVASVKAKEIEKQPVNNPLLALQGRVPGLLITQSTGLPGTGVTVRIQGLNSISKGNDPLYVIDGVPFTSQLLPTVNSILGNSGTAGIGGNPLNFINPESIESIDVLKDADATAIYGSRAANGAILITTKKGKSGDAKINVNFQKGWGQVHRKLELMNSEQYVEMRKEAYKNDGVAIPVTPAASNYDITVWEETQNTDWQEKLIGNTASYSNLQMTFSGGSLNTQYLIGTGFSRESSVFPGDFNDKKASVHFNINSKSLNQKLRLQVTGSYMFDNNQLPGTDLTTIALSLAPNAPFLYDDNGKLNWARIPSGADSVSTWNNPIAYTEQKFISKTHNLIGNAVLGYQVLNGLEVKSSFGYNYLQTNEISTVPLAFQRPENRVPSSRRSNFGNNNIYSWICEPQIVYKKTLDIGNINALIGSTFQQVNSNRQHLTGTGYNSDEVMQDIRSASSITAGNSVISSYKYNAFFGRLNYNWRDKYIININGRRDGSSRFGSKNQFHDFWSVSGAWIFSSENIFKKKMPFISFGKLKVSYGTTGNDQIGDYSFYSLYIAPDDIGNPYQGMTGLQPSGLSNPYLQWEETTKLQGGLDLGLFSDRVLINLTYFLNKSGNQLESYSLPIQTGFYDVTRNFAAKVQNSGWEFSVSTINFKSQTFKWASSINLTVPKNKLVSFPNLETSSKANSLVVGQSINLRKLYPFIGVDPITGLYLVSNKDGDATSAPSALNDKTVIISLEPKFYGGFQNSFTFKNFELGFLFQFVKQIKSNYSFGNNPGSFLNVGTRGNQPLYVYSRWQKSGDEVNVQKYSASYPSAINRSLTAAYNSDRYFADASFVRLKNLSLSFQLPQKLLKNIYVQDLRLYIQGQNLLTITDYNGLDPENGTFSGGSSLPPLRVVTFGLNVSL